MQCFRRVLCYRPARLRRELIRLAKSEISLPNAGHILLRLRAHAILYLDRRLRDFALLGAVGCIPYPFFSSIDWKTVFALTPSEIERHILSWDHFSLETIARYFPSGTIHARGCRSRSRKQSGLTSCLAAALLAICQQSLLAGRPSQFRRPGGLSCEIRLLPLPGTLAVSSFV